MSEPPRPFTIAIPDAELDDLHDRLARTRWPDQLPDAGWEYGIPLGYLRELAEYWRTEYDWRRHEARLNTLPQFTTTVDGANLHFIHVRSPHDGALPLLISHGWPGSVAEFLHIIGPLADPAAHGGDPRDAFHVVAPSLPGYGLSGPTVERGWDFRRMGRAFAELMRRLGYGRYGAHGGDWGAAITQELGTIDADHLAGLHLTMLLTAGARRSEANPEVETERLSLRAAARYQAELNGYAVLQATKPQTLSYALTDSPVGQLAWIVERFKDWTDSAQWPEDAVDRDQLLTNVMLYWLTATAGSSARLYYETAHPSATAGFARPSAAVPTAVAVFPHDIARPIRRLAERTNHIVRWTEFEAGGHFPAMEVPAELIGDLRSTFRTLR